MKDPRDDEILTLLAHVEKHRTLLESAKSEIDEAGDHDIPLLGKTPRAGILTAGLLENYYTCAETLLFRISQCFENHLSAERWHKDLLEKMTLDIEEIRPRVLSDSVYQDLAELMRFRHFKRYYFGTAWDWTRLDELLIRLHRMHSPLMEDLKAFIAFLRETAK